MLGLRFMGVPEVVLDGQPVAFRRRGSIALLAYLVQSHRAHPREALAMLLAGDNCDGQAHKLLSNVLVDLRQRAGDYVIATRQTVAFNRGLPHQVDTAEFQRLVAESLESADLARLDATLALYRDDFLAGLVVHQAPDFEAWQSAQRDELRGLYLQLLRAKVELCMRQAAWSEGIVAARRLLAEEPWHEEGHRALMLMLARTGQRQAALRQYQVCRQVLTEELGVEPTPESAVLFDRLRCATTPPTHNLPPPNSPFVGRREQLKLLVALLGETEPRLVTIAGLGGSGKTRLALEVARSYATAAHAFEQPFADGIFLISFSDPAWPDGGHDNVPTARALEHILSAVEPASERAASALQVPPYETLVAHLRARSILLVLDDVDRVGDGGRVLADLLAQAPNLKILATSKLPLDLGPERVMQIDGLELPQSADTLEDAEASELFLQEARRVQIGYVLPQSDRPCLVRLCQLVGGLPLALVLAARWAPMLSCAGLVTELERSLDVLSSAEHDVPERHRDLAALLGNSLRGLPAEEQTLARTLATAEECRGCGAPNQVVIPSAALPGLRVLRKHALVCLDQQGVLSLHPLVSLYLRGRRQPAAATRIDVHHGRRRTHGGTAVVRAPHVGHA
jgi:DNA-binding SARP family transcriptional activator